jgi:hypothetical protein
LEITLNEPRVLGFILRELRSQFDDEDEEEAE